MIKKVSFLFLFFSCIAFSQEKGDPKVGLVLSGGGAKGLAHIGALKVLEEAGVQIDYIGGTSMGAIVGSLYAAGYSAQQLDSIFEMTNFNVLIQDELPRGSRTFYERNDAEKYAVRLPFDNFHISFPSGISRGQNVYNMMSELTLHLADRNNFEELPIPFFCVATNVETGEEVILDSGHLPQAVLASSAIPTLFSPVIVNGKLLTDGGVVNNFPVEEMRKRGADIIIGVDVQDSLSGRDDLSSAFEILTQISNFRTVKDMKEKVEETDVYIDPPIAPFGVMSFDRGRKIIDAGEEAARKKLNELQEIARLQKKEPREQLVIKEVDSLYIADIRITGNHSYPRAYVLGKLKIRYPSKVSYRSFVLGINNLSATGNFNRVNYKLIPLNGGYVMELDLEEKVNKTFLQMALHYDDLYKSGALVNLTRKSLLFTNDLASLDVVLGDNFRYNFEYYWDKGYYWSVGVRSRYNSFNKSVGIDFTETSPQFSQINLNRISIDYKDVTNQLYFETLFEQVFSIGVGAEHKFLEVSSETISDSESTVPSTVFDRSSYFSTFSYLKFDSYDNRFFPGSGFYFNGDFHLYLLSSDYNEDFSEFSIVKGDLGYAFSPSRRFTTRLSTGTGFHFGKNSSNSLHFLLGGYGNDFINNIFPFYGYDFLELSGDSYVKSMVELDYEIFRKNHLVASANFANVDNDLYGSGKWFSLPKYSGYALGYALETFMGPIEAKYSYSPDTRNSHWYFSIGFWF
ncbi:patatin-like phospholipase family protein [Salinimicrobium sp. GXAS 041]|uniref:patatin-like phospholipase family protein n=1 Tax=Salinimicrobium sp. GXAS 041 TaxID=3400806 RepID=UPI003C746092